MIQTHLVHSFIPCNHDCYTAFYHLIIIGVYVCMPLVCIVSNSVSFSHIGYVSYAKMKMCYLVTYFSCNVFRGSANKLFSQQSEITMEVGGWVLVSLGIPLVIFRSNHTMCILSVCIAKSCWLL